MARIIRRENIPSHLLLVICFSSIDCSIVLPICLVILWARRITCSRQVLTTIAPRKVHMVLTAIIWSGKINASKQTRWLSVRFTRGTPFRSSARIPIPPTLTRVHSDVAKGRSVHYVDMVVFASLR